MKKRKDESTRTDLPKTRWSKQFKDKASAKKYWQERAHEWLSGKLYESRNAGNHQVASVNTKGKYSEKFF